MSEIISGLIGFFASNATAQFVMAYVVAAWVVVTLIRNVGLLIVSLTPTQSDDKWWNKWIIKPLNFVLPFIKLLPHSTIELNTMFQKIVDVAKKLKKVFPDK